MTKLKVWMNYMKTTIFNGYVSFFSIFIVTIVQYIFLVITIWNVNKHIIKNGIQNVLNFSKFILNKFFFQSFTIQKTKNK